MAESNRTFKYKYTGRTGKHVHDGKPLAHGDVVELTLGQAAAFPDRFERDASKSETENLLHPETVPVGQMPPAGQPSPPLAHLGESTKVEKTQDPGAVKATAPSSTTPQSKSDSKVESVLPTNPPTKTSDQLVKESGAGDSSKK